MPEIEELIARDDLRTLYRMSGGVQRVLFQLLHAVAGRARGTPELPVARHIVESAVETIREDYLAVTVEAAPWLARIQETCGSTGCHRRRWRRWDRTSRRWSCSSSPTARSGTRSTR